MRLRYLRSGFQSCTHQQGLSNSSELNSDLTPQIAFAAASQGLNEVKVRQP
jgi:hypothetical protein